MKQTHEEILKEYEEWLGIKKGEHIFKLHRDYFNDISKFFLQKLTQVRSEVLEEVGKEIDLQKTDERKVANFGEWHAETYNEKMLVNAVLHDSKERILKLKTKI